MKLRNRIKKIEQALNPKEVDEELRIKNMTKEELNARLEEINTKYGPLFLKTEDGYINIEENKVFEENKIVLDRELQILENDPDAERHLYFLSELKEMGISPE